MTVFKLLCLFIARDGVLANAHLIGSLNLSQLRNGNPRPVILAEVGGFLSESACLDSRLSVRRETLRAFLWTHGAQGCPEVNGGLRWISGARGAERLPRGR